MNDILAWPTAFYTGTSCLILFICVQATEIASRVVTKHELFCKAKEIVFIEEKSEEKNAATEKFWKILNGEPDAEIRGWQ